jgi:hypothetical protein
MRVAKSVLASRCRVSWLAVLAAAILLALLTPPADARYSRKKAIWGPTQVDGVSQFPIYRDLGVGIYQMQLGWNAVAPTRPQRPGDPQDPAYRWPSEIDYAIRQGRSHGIRVALMLTQAPRWANGGRSSEWVPKRPRDFAAFARAASRRYPQVRLWMILGGAVTRQQLQAPAAVRSDRTKALRAHPRRRLREPQTPES